MSTFKTKLVVPDKQDDISGLFRVVLPSLLFVVVPIAWLKSYYPMNGYEMGFLLNLLLTILMFAIPIAFLLKWYHGLYEKKGDLAINEDTIAFKWDTGNAEREYNFDVKKVKDLQIVYDGFAQTMGNAKGTENEMRFAHDGTDYKVNFHLASEDDTKEMGQVIKKWYEQGVNVKEFNSEGDARYLLMYSPKYKKALATSAL